ncbi:MAG TPA: patatin-like phospholipase family protein [Motilibacterales bacterium]|nr:patatin-like phospholipase family protein [Motilibacterales bacterium]
MTAPRIGLVLGGGGLTGTAFHAGVIAALAESAGWDARTAEVIVGTSAGSTSAALLRAGLPPADFVARISGAPVSAEGERVLGGLGPLRQPQQRERPARRPAAPGLIASMVRRPWRYRPGIAAAALLPEGNLAVDSGVSWIGDLFVDWPEQPTWICTVRLDDGVRVVFGRDATASVRDAVTASCAIPGYFAPVVIDGHRHVDGGMWSIHNLDLVAGRGLDLVVVSAPLSTTNPLAAERGTLLRLPVRRRLDREADQVRGSGTPVLVIQPDARLREVMGNSTMRLSRRAPVAQATQVLVSDLARAGALDTLVNVARRG